MIAFLCPRCKHKHRAPDEAAGKKASCPACGQRFRVPIPSAREVETSISAGPTLEDVTRGIWSTIRLLIAVAMLAVTIGAGVLVYVNWESLKAKIAEISEPRPIIQKFSD